MMLNEKGLLAEKFWLEIPVHFPFIDLGEYVVMPNHVHGILILNGHPDIDVVETLQCNVSTRPTPGKNIAMSQISPKPGFISAIMRSYKSVVTKNIHLIDPEFEWQERFHDHIICNAASFERIQNYIINNVANWKEDEFNK